MSSLGERWPSGRALGDSNHKSHKRHKPDKPDRAGAGRDRAIDDLDLAIDALAA